MVHYASARNRRLIAVHSSGISFQDAFNRHDPDSIVALYEPDAVLARFVGPVQGTEAIREAYRDSLAMRPPIDVQTLGVNRAGDLAMMHGKWILHETGPDGGQIHREPEYRNRSPAAGWALAICDRQSFGTPGSTAHLLGPVTWQRDIRKGSFMTSFVSQRCWRKAVPCRLRRGQGIDFALIVSNKPEEKLLGDF